MFNYPAACNVITGNLKVIADPTINKIVSNGPNYRFPNHIDFDKCSEEKYSALNDYSNRWCKRGDVELDA